MLIIYWFWSFEAVALCLFEAACVIAWQAGGRPSMIGSWKVKPWATGLHSSSSGTSCCWSKQRDQHSHKQHIDVIFSNCARTSSHNARAQCCQCAQSLSNGEVADGFTHHKMWSRKRNMWRTFKSVVFKSLLKCYKQFCKWMRSI